MPFPKWIEADNISQGFHGTLLDHLEKYLKPDNTVLLVAEPRNITWFMGSYFPTAKFESLEYEGLRGEDYYDLNILREPNPIYDIVFSQALLEHVCRPSIVIENMANFTIPSGYIIMHVAGRNFEYHPYPIDCVRFFEDFFRDLERYIPIKVIEYHEITKHIFVVYQKL